MTVMISLTPEQERYLHEAAISKGMEENALLQEIMQKALEDFATPKTETLADLFAGRVGLVSSASETAFSEDTGSRFASAMAKKHKELK